MTVFLTDPNQIAAPPQEALSLAERLYDSFSKLIAALPGQPQRPMDLARTVNVDKSVAHRLVTALAKPTPMGVLLALPGPVPLAEIAKAARKLGVDPVLCAEATDASTEFDGLVQSLAGDRATFDAMLSDWVDEARSPIDTAARQLIYRGMKHVQGVAAETAYTAFLLHPSSSSSERGDEMALDCVLGLHRVRSSGNLCVRMTSDLRGSATVAESTRTLLKDFCSEPTPSFHTSGPADALTCVMDWNGKLGRLHTSDVVVGEVHRKVFTYSRSSPARKFGGLGCTPWVPVRRAIVDLMLHRDIFPTCIPSFIVSRTGIHGLPDPNDPQRLQDRIRMECDIQAVSTGNVTRNLTPEVPFYRRLLESQCKSLGWDINAFRAFRVRIDYPIFDAQMMFVITLPEAPDSRS
jgi:hypothetical protein